MDFFVNTLVQGVARYGRDLVDNRRQTNTDTANANTQISTNTTNRRPLLDPYTYETLPTPSSIRLLSFSRDDGNGYSCSLHVFEIDSAPPFQALSYTWGDPLQYPELEGLDSKQEKAWADSYKDEVQFRIDGKGLTIKPGRSLHEALSRLWDADTSLMESKYIWVDALCINQQDKQEKKAQVLMMGEIYSKAAKVIAWLGPALDLTSNAIRTLEKLSRLKQESWTRMQTMDMTSNDIYGELGIAPIFETDRQSFSGFLMRGWFSRVWIVQEAVFARSIIFLCGEHLIKSNVLSRVSKMLVLTGWSNQLMKLDVPEIGTKQMVPPGGIAAVALMKEEFAGIEKPSPLNIMVSTRSRQATEPADSVYGILNVLALSMGKRSGDLLVQPEAGKPLPEVMENTTLMIIRHEGNLRVLHQVQERSLRAISGCSSWAVNWRQRMVPEPLIMATPYGVKWEPAGSWKKQCLDTSVSRKLKFKAAKVSTIIATTLDLESLDGDFGAWLKLATDLSKEPYGIQLDQGIAEILWRTVVADSALDQSPAPDDVGYALVLHCLAMHCHRTTRFWAVRAGMEDALFCDAIKRFNAVDRRSPFPSDEDIPSLLWALRGDGASLEKPHVRSFLEKDNQALEQFLGRINSVMLSRRLARTENNLFAAVPASSRSGDEVWIIPELQTPFVFREVEAGEYEFVGEAYVHGVMHGEMSNFLVFEDITLR